MSPIAYAVQYLLGRSNELFPEHGWEGGVNIGRRIKCIICADDTALLTEDERMMNMLMELNER